MTGPTGTEATTARIAEVLADVLATDDARHEMTDYMQAHARGHTSSNSPHYFYCDGNCASRAALTWVTRYLRDHVAAALSAGVIRDMQAAALREAATALDMEPIPNHLWGQPNKKAWFCEGARWVLDQVRDRAARIEEQR